jgi:hypothetical protein
VVVTTPRDFRAAVREYGFNPFALSASHMVCTRRRVSSTRSPSRSEVTGASHATLDAQLEPKGETMAALLAGERAGLVPAMLKYDNSSSDAAGTDHISAPRGDACLRPGSAIR